MCQGARYRGFACNKISSSFKTVITPLTLGKGGVDSGPGYRRFPELVQTDGPGFSLCATPLESSGPGFCGIAQRLGERVEVRMYTGPETSERTCRE